MNVPCPVCGGKGWTLEVDFNRIGIPWQQHCNACGGTGYQDDGAGSERYGVVPGGYGIIPELSASSRLAAAEARIRELDALVAEAREIIVGLQDMQAMPSAEFDADVNDWLARTAPKEPEHG